MQLLNQSRQLLAVSIVLFALYYLINYSKKYYLLIIIASLIHFTALFALLFPLFYMKRNKNYKIKNSIFYFIIFSSPLILPIVFKILPYLSDMLPERYSGYLSNINVQSIGLGFLLTMLPIIIPVILLKSYAKDAKHEFLLKIGLTSFPIRLAGYYSYYVMRIYYYGAIAMILFVPLVLKEVRNRRSTIVFKILIIFVYIFYYLIYFAYLDPAQMFPYKIYFGE